MSKLYSRPALWLPMLVLVNITVSIGRADLVVSSNGTNSVLSYDQMSGAFLGAFVTSGSGV